VIARVLVVVYNFLVAAMPRWERIDGPRVPAKSSGRGQQSVKRVSTLTLVHPNIIVYMNENALCK
jgi:hypothetical protein